MATAKDLEAPLVGDGGSNDAEETYLSPREGPLITEEARRRPLPPPPPPPPGGRKYLNRTDAIAYGTRLQKAAALVDLAEDGIGIPEQLLTDDFFEESVYYYFLYTRLDWLWTLNIFAMVLLNFLETPLWCWSYIQHSCEDRAFYFLGELPYISKPASLSCEGITIIILAFYIFFPLKYEGWNLWWASNFNKLKLLLVLFLACDIMTYALIPLPFRAAPYIRVVFLATTIRELRNCAITLGGVLWKYLSILALWLLFLLFSSWLAYVTFEDTLQGKEIFASYSDTLYQMFLLFSASNNPDVWIPAYKESRSSFLFFLLYLLIGVYFVTNLILAVIYDSFKGQFAKKIIVMDNTRKRILNKAFDLTDDGRRNYLDKYQCISLLEELNKYRTLPQTSREDFDFIFDELDRSGDFKIDREEFKDLCNAIALKFEKEPPPSYLEKYQFYHSPSCKKLKEFVQSQWFEYAVIFVLVLNLVAVIIETTLDIENSSAQGFWQRVEFSFGWIYLLEMALKIFSSGFGAYWMSGQNQFDFVITWTIFIGEALTFGFPSMLPFLSNGEWIRYLLVGRMLRLTRILLLVPHFRAFVATFWILVPNLMPYLGIIFCVQCIYCSLGVQLFGGIVNSGNPALPDTDLYNNDYLLFNFNDFPSGMVALVNMLVLNNWQVWMESYRDLTGSNWTLAYFISFYLLAVLLLLNLIVAFVLDTFFAEMELEKDASAESDTKDGLQTRRRKVVRVRTTGTVDKLLHHMLSDEIGTSEN